MKQKNKIPKDWQVIKLNNLFETIPNLSNVREDLTDIAQKVMYIHYGDIHTNSIHEKINLKEDTLPYLLDNKIKKDINDMLLKNGDVIITDASEDYEGIAKSVEITNINNKKVVAGLHTIVLRPIKNIVAIGYGSYLLQMPITSKKLKSISQGTKVISISFQLIKDLDLFLPPIKEQEKIVEILELWDKTIETTKKLIEQKKLQKKYLMQKLLTGKIRLKGFKDKWNNNQLKTLCSIKKGEQLNSNQLSEQNLYPCLNGGILPSGYTNKWNTEKNTITISEGGNSCGYVNFMKNRFWAGGHCYTLINVNINLEFLYLVLKFKEKQIMLLRVGSGLPNIQKTDLEKMYIRIPTDIAEQKAIANILSTTDNQINLLEQKLSKLELEKKGLMQKLLTGKIRVGR